jgi:hypothetical protein
LRTTHAVTGPDPYAHADTFAYTLSESDTIANANTGSLLAVPARIPAH